MTDWEPLLRRLRDRTGFVFGSERMPEVEAATRQAMDRASVDELSAWLELVDLGRASMTDLVDELMVGETYFFREPAQLRLLEDVLPRIPTAISLWSAGCASGEEAYTLAMIARELGVSDRTRILGTDISGSSLAKARAARYEEWSLRGPSAARARVWLASDHKPSRPTYTVDPRIRHAVSFDHLNLVTDMYPQQQHVIFCRNVFIYLQRPIIDLIARRFYAALTGGGWLVLASTDPPLGPPFERVDTPHGLFYRKIALTAQIDPNTLMKTRPRTPPPPVVRAAPAPRTPAPDLVAAVRQLADRGDTVAAERAATEAHRSAPMNAELYYLHAVLLVELGMPAKALESLRRALYLEPACVMAWMTLGTTLRAAGDNSGARRALKTAQGLCARLPQGEAVPMADGATAAYLHNLAAREESRL